MRPGLQQGALFHSAAPFCIIDFSPARIFLPSFIIDQVLGKMVKCSLLESIIQSVSFAGAFVWLVQAPKQPFSPDRFVVGEISPLDV